MPDAGGRDLRSELERWDGYPESWRPEPGEVLIGTVSRYTTAFATWRGVEREHPIAVVRDEESGAEVSVWLIHKVLLEEFRKLRPRPGERVGLRYIGLDKVGGYHRYLVRVDRPEEEVPDLDRFAARAEAEQTDPGVSDRPRMKRRSVPGPGRGSGRAAPPPGAFGPEPPAPGWSEPEPDDLPF